MGDFSVTIDVVDFDPKALTNLIQRSKDIYKNFRIDIDSDHAMFIEFGTNGKHPGAPGGGTGAGGSAEEAYNNILKWYMARSGQHDERKARHEVYPIFRKIMREGIPPQPFIRPAMHSVRRRLQKGGDLCRADTTMLDVCEALTTEMANNLRDNRTLYGEKRILKSIHVVWGTLEELATDRVNMADPSNGFVSSDIWNSDEADWRGNVTRARERKANIDRLRFK